MKKIKLQDIEESIYSEIDLLNNIIKYPHKYDKNIFLPALANQKNFSLYKNNEYRIISTSLNTHKYYTNMFLSSKYNYLNQLRLKAYNTLYNYNNSTYKLNNKYKVNLSEVVLKKTIENNFNLVKIIYELKSFLCHISSKIEDNNLKNEINNKLLQIEHLIRFTKEKDHE